MFIPVTDSFSPASAGTLATDPFEVASTQRGIEQADTVVCVLTRNLLAGAPVMVSDINGAIHVLVLVRCTNCQMPI